MKKNQNPGDVLIAAFRDVRVDSACVYSRRRRRRSSFHVKQSHSPSAVSMSSSPSLLLTCAQHGPLPPTCFYQQDWRAKRRRCKQCVKERLKELKRKHPMQELWCRFAARVKYKFGVNVTWSTCGQACVERAVQQLDPDMRLELERNPLHFVLTWPSNTSTLDLEETRLMPSQQARRRPRQQRRRRDE